VRDDTATTTGGNLPANPGAPGITDLGDKVFQINVKVAGYQGITAG
jgi:hypothetical protein